jgi:hypothetical protein
MRLMSVSLIALASLAMLCATALSQETDAAKDDKSPILLRVICKQPVDGATALKIVQGGQSIHDLEITTSLMTDPLAVQRGELLLARPGGTPEKPTFDPVLKVTIPDQGKRFVLALFSAPRATPAKPYEYRLVRTDGDRFGASDLYLFNLTTIPVAGSLGKSKFTLAPDKSLILKPVSDQPDGRMYQCQFYYQSGDKARLFNDTRWPLSVSARVYLFFIPDLERQSIGYLSFREYEPFP